MKTTLSAIVLRLLLGSPVAAAELIPQQFVGDWCIDSKASEATRAPGEETSRITVYKRARKCESDPLYIRRDRLAQEDEECAFLKIVNVTRHGTHRLRFRCSGGRIYQIWISVPGRNEIAVQDDEPE